MKLERTHNQPEVPREPVRMPAHPPVVELGDGQIERHRDRLDAIASDPRRFQLPERQQEQKMPLQKTVEREKDGRVVERRPARPQQHGPAVGLNLRPEERQVLRDVGRFRTIDVRDLARNFYQGKVRLLQDDLRYLRDKGLVRSDWINARRDGRRRTIERIEVVSLTKQGKKLVEHSENLLPGQRVYAELVKPRETEHDTQIYRAYLKEAERINRSGGKNLRVELDFELKTKVYRAVYAEKKAAPERDLADIRQQVAYDQKLPLVDGKIQIPDARVHYELDESGRTAFSDIEVVTAAYRPGHLRGKAAAGFRLYVSSRDAATLGSRIENEHHILDWTLDL